MTETKIEKIEKHDNIFIATQTFSEGGYPGSENINLEKIKNGILSIKIPKHQNENITYMDITNSYK
jgi:hypothetical protein